MNLPFAIQRLKLTDVDIAEVVNLYIEINSLAFLFAHKQKIKQTL